MLAIVCDVLHILLGRFKPILRAVCVSGVACTRPVVREARRWHNLILFSRLDFTHFRLGGHIVASLVRVASEIVLGLRLCLLLVVELDALFWAKWRHLGLCIDRSKVTAGLEVILNLPLLFCLLLAVAMGDASIGFVVVRGGHMHAILHGGV